jgi:transposase-like protein
VGGLLLGGRGRLTSATYRLKTIELVSEAQAGGAALVSACSEIGICLRTLKRWRKACLGDGGGHDRRNGSPRLVLHKLSGEERQRILLTCNQPESASQQQGQIVPALADQGLYIGSESSFYRGAPCPRPDSPTRPSTATTGTKTSVKAPGRRGQSGLELGHHRSAHHRARHLAVPLPGDRNLEPPTWPKVSVPEALGRGLGCR